MFSLNPILATDTRLLGRLPLSLLLLMDDTTYPWVILVPQRAGLSELYELAAADRAALMEEVVAVSGAMMEVFQPDKLNVAALGNVVPQLHVHVVARFRSDPVWPAPVWGRTLPVRYMREAAATVTQQLRAALASLLRGEEEAGVPAG
jgi:diadenosine tetraphosphate (Ap4A) HIT family hydrolase